MGFRNWGDGLLWCRVQESGLRFRLWGSGIRVQGTLGIFSVQGSGFGVECGLRFGVQDLRIRLSAWFQVATRQWKSNGLKSENKQKYYVGGTAFKTWRLKWQKKTKVRSTLAAYRDKFGSGF